MKRFALLSLLLAVACERIENVERKAALSAAAHGAEVEKWRTNRIERLKKEDSWLTLVGLHWLKDGENKLDVGSFTLKDGKVTLDAKAPMTIKGQPVTGPTVLADDSAEDGPTIVQSGSVRFNIIKRGTRYAVRVKDANAKTRTEFAGIEMFPINPKWRVEARIEPYKPPKKVVIDDITGLKTENSIPGALVFEIDGKEYRLDPLDEGDQFFVIFRDATSKDATYPAGRYLYTDKPKTGDKVILDFNKAYNPPCAFTPYATCPLPPLQNRLPIRIEAGEKNYKGKHA